MPDIGHTHIEYIIAVPGGTESFSKLVTIRLVDVEELYEPSEPIVLDFRRSHDDPHGHGEVIFGSDEDGGGSIKTEYDAPDHLHASFDTCLGGEGDHCEGGIAIYSVADPGFEPLAESDPDHSFWRLADGAEVALEIVAIDEGVSLKLGETTIDQPGQQLLFGTMPDIGHTHVETVIAVPGGTETFSKDVSIRLVDRSEAYGPSEQIDLNYRRAHDDGGGHEGEHEGEHSS
jgi:hypothetical protein